MNQISPKVPQESPPNRIHIFKNNKSLLGYSNLRRHTAPVSATLDLKFFDHDHLQLGNLPHTCKCPQVLVSDDDPFQELYYQTLFLKSMELNILTISDQNFTFLICRSGEELIENYLRSKACGCGSNALIITDFNMGRDKLNGIETASTLRKHGYKGPIVLRTSEEIGCFRKEIFGSSMKLMETKIIDYFLEKSNHIKTKNILQELLSKLLIKDRKWFSLKDM